MYPNLAVGFMAKVADYKGIKYREGMTVICGLIDGLPEFGEMILSGGSQLGLGSNTDPLHCYHLQLAKCP